MGNYYRSRLAEELCRYYAAKHGLEVEVDSGGIAQIPNPNNPGQIAKGTLRYLEQKNVQPQGSNRDPKACNATDVYSADIVVCTDEDEQRELFTQAFPDFTGRLICWRARDQHYDPLLQTPDMIDKNTQRLILDLVKIKN